jgi:glutamate synthase (NADPH/NADH)
MNAALLFPTVDIHGGSLKQDFKLEERMDNAVVEASRKIIDSGTGSIRLSYTISNYDRAFGTTLSYEISKYVYGNH